MTGVAESGGAAYDAEILTGLTTEELRAELVRRGSLPLVGQDYRLKVAEEAEAAVVSIQAKLDGLKASLATAKADAKRLRAEADEGGGD